MSNITAAQVKELRERTGAGMMECKKALQAANGDIAAAIEAMRKSGQAKAAKKSGRVAAEGVVAIGLTADHKAAIMLEINTETDFAARDENFKTFVDQVVASGLAAKAATLDELLAQSNIAQANEELVAKIGENIKIRRVSYCVADQGIMASYCHGGRIGVLVNIAVDDIELGKDLAMHIAASKPEVIAAEDLSPEVVAKEREIFIAQAAKSGKPQEIIEKMVAGKVKKFMSEVSLLGQPFVKDPTITVAELLKQKQAKVIDFQRYEVGEGVEKVEADFAAEVMAQVEGTA